MTQAPAHHENPIFGFASLFSRSRTDYVKSAEASLDNNKSLGEMIYVSRQDARNARILINEPEIEARLAEIGFKSVNSSQHSPEDLASIFFNARVIVGPLGAGLLNSITSKPGTRIVALTAPSYYEAHVAQVSSLKGHRLRYVIGEK